MKVLFLLLVQYDLQMAELSLGLCDSSRPVLLLFVRGSPGHRGEPFALQHLQQLLDGLVPGAQGLLLCLNPQLHLLQRLPQQEELLGLAVVLGLQAAEVLLGQLDGGEVIGSGGSGVAFLLQEVVQVPLCPQLILKSLDGHLKMLKESRDEH